MKSSFPFAPLVCRIPLAASLALSVLLLSGCGDFSEIVELEDPEPVQGTYQARAFPSVLAFTPSNLSRTVSLTAFGVGSHLPPDIDQNQAAWVASSAAFYSVAFANASSAATTAIVTYTGPLIPEIDGAQWIQYVQTVPITFTPTNVPAGMSQQAVSINASFHFVDEIEEEEAEKPRLTVLPAQVSFLPGATRVLTVVYKGPDAHFTSGGLSQTGSAFSINPSFPALKDGVSFAVPITFSGTAPASTATFYLNTSNGVSAAVPLTGLGP